MEMAETNVSVHSSHHTPPVLLVRAVPFLFNLIDFKYARLVAEVLAMVEFDIIS